MRYRAPLEAGEYVVTCNRAHPLKLVRPLTVLLAGIFLSSMVQVLASQTPAWGPVAPVLLAAAALYAIVRIWNWLVTGYALTDRRIVIFRSLRARRPLALMLENLTSAGGGEGLAARTLGCGTVRLSLPGQVFELTCQNDPAEFLRLCREQRERRLRALWWRGSRV